MKKVMKFMVVGMLSLGLISLAGCKSGSGAEKTKDDKAIIYTNADEEPVKAMEKALDENGFKGKYLVQSLGTSELGGKLLAEGKNLEADIVTMSTFYLDSAEEKNKFLEKLDVSVKPLQVTTGYTLPLTVQEGVVFYNTKALKEAGINPPKSLKDLAKPEYAGQLSISDIKQSSTAWLLFQGLIDTYGEDEAKAILAKIYENAGDHIEASGSGPLKKVKVGEVAIGYGLRHQAVAAKKAKDPIDYVEPSEGTYNLTESIGILNKGQSKEKMADLKKMVAIILTTGRKEIITYYPSALYEEEKTDGLEIAKDQKVYSEKLTPELLAKHQGMVE